MSVASCSYQCGWTPDNATITVSLLSPTGDLFQRYSGSWSSPGDITPSWAGLAAASRPVLAIVAMESDASITQAELASKVIDDDTQWYIDDLLLTFGSDGLCTSAPYTGLLRKLTAAAGTRHRADAPYGGLEICGNLVTATGGHTVTVKVIAAFDTGGSGSRYQGSTPIRMLRSTGQGSFANIYCDPTDSFILDSSNPSVIAKVKCWQGSGEVTPASWKWYLLIKGAWTLKATTSTFTVDQSMIDTFGDIRVECYDAQGNLIASDIQTVQDAEDPYVIYPNPTPADAMFYAVGGPDKVTFAPKTCDTDGNEVTGIQYYFAVYDSAGNPLNTADATQLKTTYDVPSSWARSINEGPVVNITAEET